MQSPRDPSVTLVRTELLEGLLAHRCPATGGVWIDTVAYWDWFRAQPDFPAPSASFESPAPAPIEDDSDRPLISPRSGRLMRKCRVGSGLGFRIDFDTSSGFWLDKGEYDALVAHNLHDEMHLICSPQYQLRLIRMRATESERRRFERALGVDACDRIAAFSAWMAKLRDQPAASAYLSVCLDEQLEMLREPPESPG